MSYNKTFKEIYNDLKISSRKFVKEIAAATGRQEITVRKWLCGAAEPDALTKQTIAAFLKTDAAILFPPTNNKKNEENGD